MYDKEIRRIENYFEVFLIVTLVFLFFLIIQEYLMALLLSATCVFLTRDTYLRLAKKTKNPAFAAFMLIFLILVIIVVPSYFLLSSVISETSNLITFGNEALHSDKLSECDFNFCRTIENNIEFVDTIIQTIIQRAGEYLTNSYSMIIGSVTKFFIGTFIFILGYFFLQKDGDKFMKYVRRIIPMKEEYKTALFMRFKDVTTEVFRDSILVAMVQGGLVGIGLWFVGMNSPVFWGIVASFFALIPMIGAGIVWVPVNIYLFLIGDYVNGIILLLYGTIIISFSDNVIRAYLLNKKVSIHPFIIFLSIMGGLEVFGFMGIFLGPVIISLLISVLQLYKLDFR